MKLLLIGYYGYGNTGDEALLTALIDSLKAESEFEFSVLSYNVEKTEKVHGVKGISRGKHMALIKAIRTSDAVVVGGGSILQDVTSSLSLYYYLTILFLAKLFGKKAFLVGNGYGPVNKRLNQGLVAFMLRRLNGVIARDKEACERYRALGVKKLFCGVDLVYLLDAPQSNDNVEKNVVISLRKWHNNDNTKAVIAEAIEYLKSLGYQIKLLSMKQPEDDSELNAFVSDDVKLIAHDIVGTSKALAAADFVIAMRLHALILAANSNTPFIAISYDPKVDSFNKQVSHKKTIHTEDMNFAELKQNIDDTIANLEQERKVVTHSTLNNKRIAKEQIKTFVSWLLE